MKTLNITTVAIVGGGIASWMAGAFLAKMLGRSVSIKVIDLGAESDPAITEATLPPLKAFHATLGVNEVELLTRCQGSMKLGAQFVNWGKLGNRYFHPHGAYGAEFDLVPLHQWWLKARHAKLEAPQLEDLSMAWALAKELRFSLPSFDRRLVQSTFDYALHLDLGLYRDYLSTFAKALGVNEVKGQIQTIDRDSATGFVTQIVLQDGQSIAADLFVDCGGSSQSALSNMALEDDFVDWTSYLPCDKVVKISCVKGGEFTPYSRITAHGAGWQWRIPLQHRSSMGYVYASAAMSDDTAAAALMDNLDGPILAEPETISFKNGRRQRAFDKNVVAIGGAAGFLEPLEATGLHFVQSGLTRLMALWPTRACDPLIAHEYNELTRAEWDLARDFLILDYKATSRIDSPFWRACNEMVIPDSLQARLDHWQSTGRLVSPRPELFQAASWLSVLVGQDIIPISWDPLADAREDQVDYQDKLAGLSRIIRETAAQMPTQREWIDKHARGARI